MVSRHTGYKTLLSVETPKITLTIRGVAAHPLFQNTEVLDREATLRLVCDEECHLEQPEDYMVASDGVIAGRHITDLLVQPLFYEQQNYEVLIVPAEGEKPEFWHDSLLIRNNIGEIDSKHHILSGMINFRNEIGLSDLTVLIGGKRYLTLTLEVYPTKLRYKEDYKAIVTDITTEIYNLAFEFLRKTYTSLELSDSRQSSPVEFFAIIQKIYERFLIAADVILHNPHHQLRTEHEVLPAHKIKRTDDRTMRWVEKHPEYAKRDGDRLLVEKALAVRKYVTYDTAENRLSKFMLEQTVRQLRNFQSLYRRMLRDTDETVIRKIDRMTEEILRRCNSGFMKNVAAMPSDSGMSLVFGMAPGYRELYRCYLMLQHGLKMTGNVFDLSVKDLAVLYEYWCFIKLNSLLRGKYKLVSSDVIRTQSSGLFVTLEKGRESRVKYLDPRTGEQIVLSYNPKRNQLPTVTQKPDNVLHLEKKSRGDGVAYEYVFDAKYRVNPALPDTDYQKVYKTPGPETDDINTMHRYRDAIVYENGASPYERTMFGAYVLFPYNDEEEYKNHILYQSIEKVNIGGLPFLPSATSLVEKMLDELITDTPESAFERATLPIGIERKLAKVDWARRDVLVGRLPSPEQLEECLERKTYYAPLSQVRADQLTRYVALYQTQSVFHENAQIQYYGEVISSEIVAYDEESKEQFSEPQRCFTVREWKKLDRPIMPVEMGSPWMYTNLFLLEHSTKVPELYLKTEEEYRLYTELKRRTADVSINDTDTVDGFSFGDKSVAFVDGKIQVYEGGVLKENSCTVEEFVKSPNRTFRRLISYI